MRCWKSLHWRSQSSWKKVQLMMPLIHQKQQVPKIATVAMEFVDPKQTEKQKRWRMAPGLWWCVWKIRQQLQTIHWTWHVQESDRMQQESIVPRAPYWLVHVLVAQQPKKPDSTPLQLGDVWQKQSMDMGSNCKLSCWVYWRWHLRSTT